MIEQILIQNFQVHDKLRINFDPGITCIVGPSDVGKSAILRALRWVSTNTPGGDAFVRHGTAGTTVRLVVDGRTIVRRRSPGGDVNEYHLDDQKYKAFGRGVPEPIGELLRLGSVSWQGQHDAPYWLSDTAGEVSRQLNAIVNLGVIDETLSGVGRAVHRARTKLELAEEELTRTNLEYTELAWVDDFVAAVEELEAVEAECHDRRDKAATVAALYQAILHHRATQENATAANRRGEILVKRGHDVLVAQKRVDALRRLVATARQAQKTAEMVVPSTAALDAAMKQYQETRGQATALRAVLDDIRKQETRLCHLEHELKKAEATIPETCPTCGQYLSRISTSKHGHQ